MNRYGAGAESAVGLCLSEGIGINHPDKCRWDIAEYEPKASKEPKEPKALRRACPLLKTYGPVQEWVSCIRLRGVSLRRMMVSYGVRDGPTGLKMRIMCMHI
jgi:hypothetical protein